LDVDYIVVGAGSAGCVLANRLSANSNNRVLLLEAGGGDLNPFLHVPAGWAANFKNPRVDWGYTTAPEPELDNREIYWPRGKVLGGSSAINGMIYIRGVPLDYDSWAQAGNKGWGWDDVLPYFMQAENQVNGASDTHGADGPQAVQDVRDKRPIQQAFIDALIEQGLPANPDFNDGDQYGAGYYQFTQYNGRRYSTATAYLRPAKSRPNLTVATHALAQRIRFDGKRATGVEYLLKGKPASATAHKQVILCGGTVNSPQLLELSGVGNSEHLASLGIDTVHHLPGVGENLQDHVLASMVYGCPEASSINREVSGWRLAQAAMKWFFLRDGPLTTGSAPVGGFFYTRDGLDAPDVQLHFASGATLYNEAGKIKPTKYPAMTAVVNQNRPESRGSLHIKSASPSDYPLIQPNYLSAEVDRITLLRALEFLQKVFESNALDGYRLERIAPAPEEQGEDALLAHIRRTASTVYHPVGTCKMGSDPDAVVSDQLRVHGVGGLMVADASVMPLLVSGNTNAAAIMIGEKAAELALAAS